MSRLLYLVTLSLSGFIAAGQLFAATGIDTNDPVLPPDGVYLSPSDVHVKYGNNPAALQILFSRIEHQPFKDLPPRWFSGGAVGTTDEEHDFKSHLEGDGQCLGAMCGTLNTFPVSMNGRVVTRAFNKGPLDTTGTFQTEMLSMNLTGGGGVMVRESPTKQSLGQTAITGPVGGPYHIDSFFDVFTELSLDGGQSWIPSNMDENGVSHSTHVDLYAVPEPASIALLGMALIGLAGMGQLVRRR